MLANTEVFGWRPKYQQQELEDPKKVTFKNYLKVIKAVVESKERGTTRKGSESMGLGILLVISSPSYPLPTHS